MAETNKPGKIMKSVFIPWETIDRAVTNWFNIAFLADLPETDVPDWSWKVEAEKDDTDFNIRMFTRGPILNNDVLDPCVKKLKDLLAQNYDLSDRYSGDWDIWDMLDTSVEHGWTSIDLPCCLSCRLVGPFISFATDSCVAVYDGVYFFQDTDEEARKATEPQEYGHWVDALIGDTPVQVCDKCNTFFPLAYTGGGHRFCPNCGKPMWVDSPKPTLGVINHANGENEFFYDEAEFLQRVKETLDCEPPIGLHIEVLANSEPLKKRINELIYGAFGEEPPEGED